MVSNFRVLAAAVAVAFLPSGSALALDAYSDAQADQFMDWCTGTKTQTDSVCSCALKRLAVTVPPAALGTFLSSQGSFSMSTAAIATAATVTDSLVACSK